MSLRIGVLQSDGPDYQNNHIHWFYYDSYIAFENKVYYGCINIKETNNDYNFYDINKIKEVETSTPLNMERGSNLNNNITNDNSDVKKMLPNLLLVLRRQSANASTVKANQIQEIKNAILRYLVVLNIFQIAQRISDQGALVILYHSERYPLCLYRLH